MTLSTATTSTSTTTNLRLETWTAGEWCVADLEGGRWWPSAAAEALVAAGADPVALCATCPYLGRWTC